MSYPPPSDEPNRAHPQAVAAAEFQQSQKRLAAVLFVCMIGSLAAWFANGSLNESGFYFITIPGSMAVMMSLLPGQENQTGYGVFRGTLICVLASAFIVREGLICVVMALPLIAPIIGLVVWNTRRNDGNQGQFRAVLLPLLLVIGFGAEGVAFDFPTEIEASETRIVDATSEQILDAFAIEGQLPQLKPLLFSLPFPRATAFVGEGSEIGDHRIVQFGEDGEDGNLMLQVTDRSEQSITWDIIEDTTPISGWVHFRQTKAAWRDTDDGLELTVTIAFERQLSPAFYFDPLQRWGVGEMAEVLVDMVEHNVAIAEQTDQLHEVVSGA